jgi:hypothetical protein
LRGNDQSLPPSGPSITSRPPGWVPLHQWAGHISKRSCWSQETNDPTGPAGSVLAVSYPLPVRGACNLVAVELVNDDDDG